MRTDLVDLQFDLQFMIVCECIAFYSFDGHIFLHLNSSSVFSDMTTISFQSVLLCWRMILCFVRFEATDAADITRRLYTLHTAAVGLNLDRPDSPKKKKKT